MRKTGLLSIILLAMLALQLAFVSAEEGVIACTQDAKLCPDGSYVGRTGANCEFAECPAVTACPADAKLCPDGSYVGRTGDKCEFKDCPIPIIACTEEAKQCPDGSYVSREGPNCEFKACPTKINCGNGICEEGEAGTCPACSYENPPCQTLAACQLGTCTKDCAQTPHCTDSDDGKNYYIKGTAKNATNAITDTCAKLDTHFLREVYCDNTRIAVDEKKCDYGCSEGACVKCQERPACLDATPACMIAEPVAGWCKQNTTCQPRPACIDADIPCKIAEPAGGWCKKECTTASDCPSLECIRAPCPSYACKEGKCVVQRIEKVCGNGKCEDGERDTCKADCATTTTGNEEFKLTERASYTSKDKKLQVTLNSILDGAVQATLTITTTGSVSKDVTLKKGEPYAITDLGARIWLKSIQASDNATCYIDGKVPEPTVYESTSPDECRTLGERIDCRDGFAFFKNATGCGCKQEIKCPPAQARTALFLINYEKTASPEATCPAGCRCTGDKMTCQGTNDSKTPVDIRVDQKENGDRQTVITEGGVDVRTKESVNVEGGKIILRDSDHEVKIRPENASRIAMDELKLITYQLEIRDGERPIYSVNGTRQVRFLGLFRTSMDVRADIDATNGTVIRDHLPWWNFLAWG